MGDNIEIVLLDISSLDVQLKIHQAAFGAIEEFGIREYWIKKHYHNPLGNSLIFGARIDNNIVGMNAFMPMEYELSNNKYYYLQSCESGVLPEFQGKGIWSKIIRYALNYISENTRFEAVIGFPNYVNSYPGFKKMGWQTICNMENYVMINNASAFSQMIGCGIALKILVSMGMVLQRALLANSRHSTVEECGIDSLLWGNESRKLTRTHSKEIICWKMDYMGSQLLSVKDRGRIIATCIYHLDKYKGGEIIKIEKFSSIHNGNERKSLIAVLRYFYKKYNNVAFVRIWTTPNSVIRPVIRRLMFVKSGHANPFIVSAVNSSMSDICWDLSFYDLD